METQAIEASPAEVAGTPPGAWARVGTLLRAALSAALLGLLVYLVNWAELGAALRAVPKLAIVTGVALMLVAQALCALRFQLLLSAQLIHITYAYSLKLTLAGAFASNFLPSTVGGDALKLLAMRWRGYRIPAVLATILLDRVANLATVTGLLVTLWWAPKLLPPALARWISGGAAVLIALGVLLLALAFLARGRLRIRLPEWRVTTAAAPAESGFGKPTRWQRAQRRLRTIVTRWWRHPQHVLAALGLSLVLNFCVQASLWLVARRLGLDVSLLEMVALTCLVLILSLLPVSINALGLQEASLSYLLVQTGAPLGQAVVVALLARGFQLAAVLPGAVCLALLRREDPR